MPYEAHSVDDGIEIRDGDEVITTVNTWPPRDAEALEDLFDHANVSQAMKGLLRILFGVEDVKYDRDEDESN